MCSGRFVVLAFFPHRSSASRSSSSPSSSYARAPPPPTTQTAAARDSLQAAGSRAGLRGAPPHGAQRRGRTFLVAVAEEVLLYQRAGHRAARSLGGGRVLRAGPRLLSCANHH